ncbi:MAG: hypothetical protein K2O85_04020 [Helicobacter sp.]|nr:hypothetical protein [Helicobacter sp.]
MPTAQRLHYPFGMNEDCMLWLGILELMSNGEQNVIARLQSRRGNQRFLNPTSLIVSDSNESSQ